MEMESNFEAIAKSKHVKQKTLNILSTQDIDSFETLKVIEDEDIDRMCEITTGQRRILLNWIKELNDCDLTESLGDKGTDAMSARIDGSIAGCLVKRGDSVPVEDQVSNDISGEEHLETASGENKRVSVHLDQDMTFASNSGSDAACLVQTVLPFEPEDVSMMAELEIGSQLAADIKKQVEAHGVDCLEESMRDRLKSFQEAKINIAVTGQSGTGKSSLINNLRNMRAYDTGAAEVGVTECSTQISSYSYPTLPNVLLWDVPGVNTPNFPKEEYINKIKFVQYDALIICNSTRFTDNDLWLSRQAVENKIPFFLVRTKIDVDIENDKRDTNEKHEPEQLLQTIKDNILDHIKALNLTPQPKLYLVSNRLTYQTKWDFPDLQKDLLENTPEKNKASIILALVCSSSEIIEKKRKELAQRIDNTALLAAGSPDSYESNWKQEIMLYRQSFGLFKSNLDKWNIKLDTVNDDLRQNFSKMRELDVMLEKNEKHMEHVMDSQKPCVFGQQYFSIFSSSAAKYIDSQIDKWNRYWTKRQLAKAECKKQNIIFKLEETKTETKFKIIEATKQVLSEALDLYYEMAKGVLKERVKDVEDIRTQNSAYQVVSDTTSSPPPRPTTS